MLLFSDICFLNPPCQNLSLQLFPKIFDLVFGVGPIQRPHLKAMSCSPCSTALCKRAASGGEHRPLPSSQQYDCRLRASVPHFISGSNRHPIKACRHGREETDAAPYKPGHRACRQCSPANRGCDCGGSQPGVNVLIHH